MMTRFVALLMQINFSVTQCQYKLSYYENKQIRKSKTKFCCVQKGKPEATDKKKRCIGAVSVNLRPKSSRKININALKIHYLGSLPLLNSIHSND